MKIHNKKHKNYFSKKSHKKRFNFFIALYEKFYTKIYFIESTFKPRYSNYYSGHIQLIKEIPSQAIKIH